MSTAVIHEPLVGVKEVAEVLGVSSGAVKRMAESGEIPGEKRGYVWRFSPAAISNWIDQRTTAASPSLGFMYAIRCGEFVKIGIACDVLARLSNIQATCPYECELLFFVHPDTSVTDAERAAHAHFAQFRHRREWFKFPEEAIPDLLQFFSRYGDVKRYQKTGGIPCPG